MKEEIKRKRYRDALDEYVKTSKEKDKKYKTINKKEKTKKEIEKHWASESTSDHAIIRFGNNYAMRIISPSRVDSIIKKFEDLNRTYVKRFSGSLAVSLMTKNLSLINDKKYAVQLKSDGIRMMMFMCKENDIKDQIDGKNREAYAAYIWDRNCSIYKIKTEWDKVVYDGTVFDGELVQRETKNGSIYYEYQIFDCMSNSGQTICHQNYHHRLDIADQLLTTHYISHAETDTMSITLKRPLKKSDIQNLTFSGDVLDVNGIKYDGIMLVPTDSRYVWGKDDKLFKVKHKHTVDFMCSLSDDKEFVNLLTVEPGNVICHQRLSLKDDLSCLSSVDKLTVQNRILECEWNHTKGLWNPIKIRNDKSISNNMFTLENTKINIQENIQIEHILRSFFI
jgi:ATP-dependent DNA ligase